MNVPPSVGIDSYFLGPNHTIWKIVGFEQRPTCTLRRIDGDERSDVQVVMGSSEALRYVPLAPQPLPLGQYEIKDAMPDEYVPALAALRCAHKILNEIKVVRLECFRDPQCIKIPDDGLFPADITTLWGIRTFIDPEMPPGVFRLQVERHGMLIWDEFTVPEAD